VTRLHRDQIDTSVDLVGRLLAEQFPSWAHLQVVRVQEIGTDHHLYRVGEDLVARLPIIGWAAAQARTDERWLPVLARHVPVALPVPVAVGRPSLGYPFPWAVVPWLPGETPTDDNVDPGVLADELAGFVRAAPCCGRSPTRCSPSGRTPSARRRTTARPSGSTAT
jgi:aminoglycoside phosphotransferase (APT) family kinase protein